MFENLKQQLFPKEFRIDPPVWPENLQKDLKKAALSMNSKKYGKKRSLR